MPRPRLGPVAAAVLLAAGGAPASPPIAPRTVTLADPAATLGDVLREVTRQTGLPVDAPGLDPATPCPADFNSVSTWAAVDRMAARVGARVTVAGQGRRVTLVRAAGPAAPASVDGPFRVAVRAVQTRTDFDAGRTAAEVTLDVHWEPRFPVFRIDGQPAVTAVADDRGSKLTAPTARAKTPPGGYLYTATVRVDGVPRAAAKLTRLAGEFVVTAADRMLAFGFDDLSAGGPVTKEQAGVTAVLRPGRQVGDRWEVRVELRYPAGQPEFESFESWAAGNRARLVAPDKSRAVDPADFDVEEQGRGVVAFYRFPADRVPGPGGWKGWSLVYETPAPLVEFPVRFDLRDIPLP